MKLLAAHQIRVLNERDDLREKITRLDSFIGCEVYKTLPLPEQFRLQDQVHYMRKYLGVLNVRIANFS